MAQDVTWDTTESSDLILSEYKEITTLLRKPVKDKRRIKYTCFDVSKNYIALGSTSGGIYLFTRDTCIFQQLIPLSNGAVNHIVISPDEKVIALSTTDENVCLVVFKPAVRDAIISSKGERNGECITALCWNDNSSELYIGDANGSIHVMGLSIFTVKRGIFQDPACPIMGLDYRIVQMDFSSPLLLISTISNCYICDTIEGQYEKVGVRTRQGEFGACFYKPCVKKTKKVASATIPKHSPSSNSDLEEALADDSDEQYPRIYCARPGSRLWEANRNGKIVKTHNFKEALAIPPTVIQKLRESKPSCIKSYESEWLPQSLKFSPLRIVASEYLFTYNSNALYILDPVNSSVILWCNEYRDIVMANVIQNHIYLMTNGQDFYCLELRSTDSKTSDIIPTQNSNSFSEKLDSGIVVVNPKNIMLKKDVRNEKESNEDVNKSDVETLNIQNLIGKNLDVVENNESLDGVRSHVNDINEDNEQKKNLDSETPISMKEKGNPSKDEINHLINDVQIIYTLANSINSSMSDNEIDAIIQALQEMISSVKRSYEKLTDQKPSVFRAIETAEQYYRNIFLSKLSKDQLRNTQSKFILNQMINSFLRINTIDQTVCECGFPHPIQGIEEPKFLDVGTVILQRYSIDSKNTCITLCSKVPYMWRTYVTIYANRDDFFDERTFAQCLQTRDDLILSFILLPLSIEQWEFALKAMTNLKLRQCLLCDRPIESIDDQEDLSINWNNVANEIMKREGPDTAVNFLTKIVTFLPSLSLNKSLFQSLIFTKILNNHGLTQPVKFNQKLNRSPCDTYSSLCCPKVQDQLLQTLEKDLHRPISKDVFGTQAHHWGMHYEPVDSICPCCTLPLQTSVLLDNNGLSLFPCGHSYHVNCLIQKNILKCNLHPE